ncbi:hypothetical protein VE01_04732 [Pseudogymnoascus verrucosus]|uniref:Metallo-beta-lactamase domain-containing protein n=1 Tax=Pseudogymnoascus verrucosus TaxID=342668 RepID=A0A1B8GN99_9PEZI|nr:uncharacterized protein VE01_04732 [Pseudogymnoascus verrucosus]OBT97313.1 hypothetical protein VE01_04732 [Pseudogymnoascus verrucosus]
MPLSNFSVPDSTSVVNVRIIDSTSSIDVHMEGMVSHAIKGHSRFECPAYSFLIEHPSSGRKVLFDLGVRKDFHNLAPPITNWLTESGTICSVEKDVSTSTALLVGPGFKQLFTPGYPTNPESPVLDSDFAGRELRELSFADSTVKVGRFPAITLWMRQATQSVISMLWQEEPFYGIVRPGMLFGDADAAEETVDKIIEADGSKNTFVVIAHDCHLKGVVDLFPKYANDFLKKGWVEKSRWVFLKDFKEAVDERTDEKL